MRSKNTHKKMVKMIHMLYSDDKGYRQSDIAEELGVSQSTISLWKKYEILDIYATYKNSTDKNIKKEIMKRYNISSYALNLILRDALDYI